MQWTPPHDRVDPVRIDRISLGSRPIERFQELAADLVRRQVTVTAAPGSPSRTRRQGGKLSDSDCFRPG